MERTTVKSGPSAPGKARPKVWTLPLACTRWDPFGRLIAFQLTKTDSMAAVVKADLTRFVAPDLDRQ